VTNDLIHFRNPLGSRAFSVLTFRLCTRIHSDTRILAGPVKLGLGAEVKIFREKTHQIPEKGFEYASNQYDRLWRDLLQFIKPDRRSASFPPLYTRVGA